MERPSSAWSWQPLLEDRPKDTVVPNRSSTVDLLRAWQTGLVSSESPLELLELLLGEDAEALGSEEESVDDAEALGEPVIAMPPCTSEATVPVPDTTWAHAAVVQAASTRALPARIRRAVMNRSSLAVRVIMWRVTW
ncbi:MAG TPA: hypothetical protein VI357_09315 [Mycobacteriales bacterium]